MNNLFKVLTILTMVSIFSVADEPVKTNEQKINAALSHITGSSIRQQNKDKEQCFKLYQGEQAQECLKGYAEQDEMLNKPAK